MQGACFESVEYTSIQKLFAPWLAKFLTRRVEATDHRPLYEYRNEVKRI